MLVKGNEACGIYNLKTGDFFRVTNESGEFLELLSGTKPLHSFSLTEQQFIEQSIVNKIVSVKREPFYVSHKALKDILVATKKPKFAWLELTSKCNQKCIHCFMGKDLNLYDPFDINKLYTIIDNLYTLGIKQIVLTGGEATLHPNFSEILNYLANYNFEITLLTNGTTEVLRKNISFLREYGIKTKMSILGWGASHDIMTGVKGSFEKLLETIDFFVSENTHIELGMTVCSINYSDIDKIRNYANNKKIKLELSPLFPIGFAIKNKELLYKHSQRDFIKMCQVDKTNAGKFFIEFFKSKRNIVTTHPTDYSIIDLKDNLTYTYECGSKIFSILASGEVTPCLLLRNTEFSLGNINKDDLFEIYLNKINPSFISKMDIRNNLDCSQCEALFACKGGGCIASTYAFYGDINHKNPYFSKCYYQGEINEK